LADFNFGDDIFAEMDESDIQLLRRFASERSEEAFAILLNRHLPLVYSAAVRQLRSTHLAEEVAQSVFVELAGSAAKFPETAILPAWLHQVTRRRAIDVIRSETRRQAREEAARQMNIEPSTDRQWAEIEPLLDEAITELPSADQEAVLLRFFQNKSLSEVGRQLGISENAAQKRIARALEKLRAVIASKGVAISSAGLAALIASNATIAAPAPLLLTIAGIAVQTMKTMAVATPAAAVPHLIMTAAQKAIVATALLATAGFGIYEHQQNSALRERLTAQSQTSASRNSIPAAEQDDAAARELNALRSENERLKKNTAELMELRAELARIRNEGRTARSTDEAKTETQTAAQQWIARVQQLKQKLAVTPEANVPELALLNEEDWLGAVKGLNLDSEKDYRRAFSNLRNTAQNKFAIQAQPALSRYMKENEGRFPADIMELEPYFKDGISREVLQRFAVVPSSEIENVSMGGEYAISQTAPVDKEFDNRYVVGPNGYGAGSWSNGNPVQKSDAITLKPAWDAFSAANGRAPVNASELKAFIKTPEEQAAYQRILESLHKEDH
jgi:RNA polymerase sigma factor (sigma-70 family)